VGILAHNPDKIAIALLENRKNLFAYHAYHGWIVLKGRSPIRRFG
jgi:hypothetical protein